MTEREQVIAELMYLKRDCLEGYATDDTLNKAIALLKAQEPRVMTLDEVVALREWKGDVWIEETAMPGIPPRIIAATLVEKTDWQGRDVLWFSNEQCYYLTDYNLNTADGWRCWTSRPTDEHIQAVKWY